MRFMLLAGGSLLALATPAFAQDATPQVELDTLVPADDAAPADEPKPTGDAVLDRLNLRKTPALARAGNQASSFTAGLTWYFNPFAKLMVNWVRFNGDNSPLDPVGDKTEADVFATRLHLDFQSS